MSRNIIMQPPSVFAILEGRKTMTRRAIRRVAKAEGAPNVTSFQRLWNSINESPKPVKTNGKVTHYISYPWEDIRVGRHV